jgi:hypothetical protein
MTAAPITGIPEASTTLPVTVTGWPGCAAGAFCESTIDVFSTA